MKKAFLSLFVLLSLIILSGCSINTAENNYINTKISSIFVSVSYKDASLEGMNFEEEELFKEEIESLSQTYLNKLTSKYRSVVDILANENIISANERILYKNHLGLYTGWDEKIFVMELRFHTATASRIFIKYCGEMKAEVDEGLFTTKVTEEITGLMDMSGSASVTEYYNAELTEMVADMESVSEENFKGVSISYMFLSSNKKLHSEGVVLENTEGVIHYFIDDSNGTVFTFYKVDANYYVWYLFALTITMVFVAVTLVVLYVKNGKKRR